MKKVNSVLIKNMIINIFLVIFKLIVGMIGSSKSLVANGIHSLSDLITDIVSILGNVMAHKPADKEHPFGYGQFEYVTSIIVGIVVLFMGGNLVLDAFKVSENIPSNLVLVVSVICFIIKYSYAKYMEYKGKEYNDSILMVSSMESKADAITTIFVVISVLMTRLSVYNGLYRYSDNVCTFIIGFYVIYISLKILKENIRNIGMVTMDNNDYLAKVKDIILMDKNIVSVKEINLIKYGSYYTGNIVVMMNGKMKVKDMDRVVMDIKKRLKRKKMGINYVNISVVAKE